MVQLCNRQQNVESSLKVFFCEIRRFEKEIEKDSKGFYEILCWA